MKSKYEKEASVFKAMSDPNRLRILDILKKEELCACRLLDDMEISQSTLSHHMKILSEAGLVKARKDGKWMHYEISKEGFESAQQILSYYK